jgi:hypothetical protein
MLRAALARASVDREIQPEKIDRDRKARLLSASAQPKTAAQSALSTTFPKQLSTPSQLRNVRPPVV